MPKISIWSSNRRVYPTMFWKWGMCLWYLYLYSSLDWGRLWLQKRYRSRLFVSDFFSTLSDFRTWENFREFLNNLAKLQLFKSGKFDQNVNFFQIAKWLFCVCKVQLFWEGHNNLRNRPHGWCLQSKFQNHKDDCAHFCGLLRKPEL